MGLANITPYFVIMAALALVSGLIARYWPFYTRLTTPSLEPNRLASLDGFRGFLATAVFFHHAPHFYYLLTSGKWHGPESDFYFHTPVNIYHNYGPAFYLATGDVAVRFFFMITGFLFWSKVLRGKLSVRQLLSSRIRRLIPMYLFSFLVILLIALSWTNFRLLEPPLSFLHEIILWLPGGLFGGPPLNTVSVIPINAGITWTLQYEWIFYLSLPLLGLLFGGRRFIILCSLFLISFPLVRRFCHWTYTREMLVYLPFLCGMTTAYLSQLPRLQNRLRRSGWSLFILLLLLASPPLYTLDRDLTTLFVLFPIFAAIVSGNHIFGLLTTRWASFLGHISYSVYLIHGIILSLLLRLLNTYVPLTQLTPLQFWGYCLLIGLAMIACATLTYRFIEHPFMHPPRKMLKAT